MSVVLNVSRLSKVYKYYGHEIKRILSWLGLPFKVKKQIHILHEINFSVQRGEAIGIIGQNGAGKSTILKIITGTIKPTSGEVIISGTVSAILELGMGFNPELTGRQNVYYACSLMGKTKSEVDRVMSSVAEFADIGDYFDQPVRTYSSGMMVRVAFSVATAFRPDLLIVDEALSVGDVFFQQKSYERIKEFQKQGTSLLIVSHDKAAILGLCTRAILLVNGKCEKDGSPKEVLDYYNALISEKPGLSTIINKELEDGLVQVTSGTREAEVVSAGLYSLDNNKIEIIEVGSVVKLWAKIQVHKPIKDIVFGFAIKNRLGQEMFGSNTLLLNKIISCENPKKEINIEIQFTANLNVGEYTMTTALTRGQTHLDGNIFWSDNMFQFLVVNSTKAHFVGYAWLNPQV